jgi:hypothetical protein
VTQSQAKRINEIAFLSLFRDQGVGGSNPLSPAIVFRHLTRISGFLATASAGWPDRF